MNGPAQYWPCGVPTAQPHTPLVQARFSTTAVTGVASRPMIVGVGVAETALNVRAARRRAMDW